MIVRYIKIATILILAFLASLILQAQVFQPQAAQVAGEEFRQVTAKVCVDYPTNGKYAIQVAGGNLPKLSKGLLSSNQKFETGDCFSAVFQLSPIDGFSRYAFKARLRHLVSRINKKQSLAILNNMRTFASSSKGDDANLVEGLAIGIDDGLSEEFLQNMKSTGLTHLTAVSGANCAIVIGAFWFLGRKIRLGRNQRFVVTTTALGGYVALVGPQPSVLRAGFMMLTVAFALEFGRRVWLPAALGLASSILLIADPWLVVDYGFWLSVLATFGLIVLTPYLIDRFQSRMPPFLAAGLAATIAAQLWCLPLLVHLQGGLTTYSILANLLVEPVVPVITLIGLISTIIGPFVPLLGQALLWLACFPAHWIVFVSNSLANAPSGLLGLPTDFFGTVSVAIFVILVSFGLAKKNATASFIALALALIWVGEQTAAVIKQAQWPISGWSVVNCDVGQGDALVIRSQKQIAVVDVGKNSELIDGCLDRLKITRIDLLVLTHFDLDHVGGLAGLEKGRSIGTALVSPYDDPRPAAKFLTRQLGFYAQKVVFGQKGTEGELGDFHWQVFSSLATLAQSANEGSLGIRFEDSNSVIYTLADLNERAQQLAIGAIDESAKTTLVKVSHHGSADQSPDFYQKIKADLALISVGKGNPYGHPTSKLLGILKHAGTSYMRTDTLGAISIRMDSAGIEARVTGAR